MASLREMIIKCNDQFIKWIVLRPLRQAKDTDKIFEIKLWMEISGALLGGQAADGAWATYKQYYYDKLSAEEKKKVRSALLVMLKSNNYDISQKAILAHVCAELGLEDALPDVRALLCQANKSSDINTLKLADESLSKGISIHELVEEKFRKGKRL